MWFIAFTGEAPRRRPPPRAARGQDGLEGGRRLSEASARTWQLDGQRPSCCREEPPSSGEAASCQAFDARKRSERRSGTTVRSCPWLLRVCDLRGRRRGVRVRRSRVGAEASLLHHPPAHTPTTDNTRLCWQRAGDGHRPPGGHRSHDAHARRAGQPVRPGSSRALPARTVPRQAQLRRHLR